MYILIHIGTNDFRYNERVSKHKNKLIEYLKEKGFYWSKINGRFVDDKTVKIDGGSGTDYIIRKVEEI